VPSSLHVEAENLQSQIDAIWQTLKDLIDRVVALEVPGKADK